MGNILIRRELPFPPGLNVGFVTGCSRRVIDSYMLRKRPPELMKSNPLPWELSVSLVDDEEIRRINKSFRNIDEPTDVLSFPQYEPEEIEEIITESVSEVVLELGDIVISLEYINRLNEGNPDLNRKSFAWMAVHSILHLFGYDHDTDDDENEMLEMEQSMLEELDEFISGVQ